MIYNYYVTSALTVNSRILWLAYIVVCLQIGMMVSSIGLSLLMVLVLTQLVEPHINLVQVRSFQMEKVRG